MSPLLLLILVPVALFVASGIDRVIRLHRDEQAIARRRWFEYSEMAARNADQWRTRI